MFTKKDMQEFIKRKYHQIAERSLKTSLEMELQILVLHWTECKKKICPHCTVSKEVQKLITLHARKIIKNDI